MKRLLASFALMVSQTCPQGPALRGPILGYVFDSGAIRPVAGAPGAAILGQPLELGEPISRAVISPRRDFALAVAASDFRVLAVDLATGKITACNCPPNPDRIAFSPSGDAAALYYAGGSSVYVLRGSAAGAGFDLSLLPGELTALALSDAGALLAAFSDGTYGTVYFLEPGREPRLVLPLRRASALAFLPGTAGALAADDAENRLYLIRDPGGRAEAVLAASAVDGIDGPVAVVAAGDSRALTANSRSGAITITDLAAFTTSAIECGFAPGGLEPLGGSVYRIGAPPSGPIWLLDGSSPELRMIFIPRNASAQVKEALQ